jgi:superfamily I DNA/RNA helicase
VSVGDVISEWRKVGREVPPAESVKRIISAYEFAKRRDGRLDFTDLLAQYGGVQFSSDGDWDECDPIGEVPENLRALAIDEAQDSSALVDRVCRRLAASPAMERVFLVGDPYQSVYGFTGSDYRHFLAWDAVESIMPRSYRCPKIIMDYGERCLRRMRTGYRDRGIMPADHSGKIRRFDSPITAIESLDPARPALILARCAFSLEAYSDALRERGVPHAFVDKIGAQSSLSGYRCLWDLEHGKIVSGDQWEKAISILAASHSTLGKLLQHGEKKAWKDGKRADIDFIRPIADDLSLAGCTEAMSTAILQGRWAACLDSRHHEKGKDWRDSAAKYGPEITSNPRIRLSTIHSAKGLEADTVILSTQSSRSVEDSRDASSEHHDEECRVNYVGVTRSRENLWIVDDSDHYSLDLPI